MKEKADYFEWAVRIYFFILTYNQPTLARVWEDGFCQYLLFLDHVDFINELFCPSTKMCDQMLEASSGVLLYTPLSSSKVFTMVAWNQRW